MPEIQSSHIAMEEIGSAIRTRKDVLMDTQNALLLKAPTGAFGEKTLLVAASSDACRDIVNHLRRNGVPVKIWHEMLDEHSAVIIDNLNVKQLEILQSYSPPPEA